MIGLGVELPYPEIKGIGVDLKSAKIILPAYASMHGELSAILQYGYNVLYYNKEGLAEISKTVRKIAITEMVHLDILGSLLLELGIDPKYVYSTGFGGEYYSTKFLNYSKTPRKMLMDGISSEMVAISLYDNMLKALDNEDVSAIIARIKMDEELHLLTFKSMLEKIN